MVNALDEARRDLAAKEAAWLELQAEKTRIRARGEELAAQVRVIGEKQHALSQEKVNDILHGLEVSIAEANRTTRTEAEAHRALVSAHRAYKKLELEWTTAALSLFHACWKRVRAASEVSGG